MNLNSPISVSGSNRALDSLMESDKSTKDDSELRSNELQAKGRDFESILYSLLLKEMRSASDDSGEGGLFAGDKSDTLGGIFDLYMSQHLASSNSLGIAQTIENELSTIASKHKPSI